jgi:hypothetical protein
MQGKLFRFFRNSGRGLRLPVTALTLIAVYSYVSTPPPAAAATPAPKPVTAPASQAVTTQVSKSANAVPAVFAHGAEGLSPKVLAAALDAVSCARSRGISGQAGLLTVIDYSLPSTEPRLWVLDLDRGEVLFHELVAHGAGSGENYATEFSNVSNSRQTSLGLFLTGETYEGGNGYSLKLRGLDPGVNDLAETRHIVMHGAPYVSPEHARNHGRIGRSWGCPALSLEAASTVIDTIKGGSFLFSYSSRFSPASRGCGDGGTQVAAGG